MPPLMPRLMPCLLPCLMPISTTPLPPIDAHNAPRSSIPPPGFAAPGFGRTASGGRGSGWDGLGSRSPPPGLGDSSPLSSAPGSPRFTKAVSNSAPGSPLSLKQQAYTQQQQAPRALQSRFYNTQQRGGDLVEIETVTIVLLPLASCPIVLLFSCPLVLSFLAARAARLPPRASLPAPRAPRLAPCALCPATRTSTRAYRLALAPPHPYTVPLPHTRRTLVTPS
jgi:hypothetical protein